MDVRFTTLHAQGDILPSEKNDTSSQLKQNLDSVLLENVSGLGNCLCLKAPALTVDMVDMLILTSFVVPRAMLCDLDNIFKMRSQECGIYIFMKHTLYFMPKSGNVLGYSTQLAYTVRNKTANKLP